MEIVDLPGKRVVIDGRQLYYGHRYAWRRGTIAKVTGDDRGHDYAWVHVQLERRGKERKRHVMQCDPGWILLRTAKLDEQLAHLYDGRDDA